jgi:hypothetical protein
MVYGMIQRQAMMLSFNDIYRTLAIVMMILIRPSYYCLAHSPPASMAAH